MMEVVRCKTKEEAIKNAGKKLNELFLSHQHSPVLFLSSGGSSLELLDEVEEQYLSHNLTVGMLDERMNVDPEASNSSKFRKTSFFAKLEAKNILLVDIFKEGFTFREKYPQGKVIITQGVGADGHTAGVFPFPEDEKKFQDLFEDKERLVVEYDAGGKTEYSSRVTVTMPFLRKVDHSVVYMVGEDKHDALERVLAEEGTLHETPGRIVREMRDATIFTDILE
ncbi:MAG: 6-phosphogluconolactonase [Candidatus Wildermuthbacteria bacterium]|nr:6-phosphogluconolactonase [Candidatus Wildermuthbacteria bacterium]